MAGNMITTEHLQGSKQELIEETRRLLSRRKAINIRTEFAKVSGHPVTANAMVNAGFAALARCIFVHTQKFGIPAGHALSGWALGTRALLFKYNNA